MRGTHEREDSAPHARPGVENAGRKTGPIREPLKDQAGTSDVRSAVGRVERVRGESVSWETSGRCGWYVQARERIHATEADHEVHRLRSEGVSSRRQSRHGKETCLCSERRPNQTTGSDKEPEDGEMNPVARETSNQRRKDCERIG